MTYHDEKMLVVMCNFDVENYRAVWKYELV